MTSVVSIDSLALAAQLPARAKVNACSSSMGSTPDERADLDDDALHDGSRTAIRRDFIRPAQARAWQMDSSCTQIPQIASGAGLALYVR